MEIIFATNNKDKLVEIREILSGYTVKSPAELGLDIDVVEDGTTFEENAVKKAEEIAKLTGRLTLADDSGLEIDFLNGQPGVYSARYMGTDTPYPVKNAKILELLAGVPFEKRAARFVCVIAASMPHGGGHKTIYERGVMEGYIHSSIDGANGFGYDPIFYLPEFGMTTGVLPPDTKNAVSHRGKALRAICPRLAEFGGAGGRQ